jgi:hypothetical protein
MFTSFFRSATTAGDSSGAKGDTVGADVSFPWGERDITTPRVR